jgi:hypothetical protein
MIRPNSKARNSYFTTQTTLFALLALSACGGPSSSDQATTTGSADITMHSLGALNLSSVVATVSGPALPTPKTLNLSARGSSGTWGGLIGSLPVGSNYAFHVSAFDPSNTVQYTGDASPIAILKDQVTTVIITAQQAAASVPFKNAVPIIDSLVLSSTNVVPGATITAKATAHDPDAGDTIAFAWSAAPGPDGFSAPTAATTGWTAPAAEGDQTLTLKVTDNHGASTSASVVVHVSASNGRGQADVNVRFNTWPVVTDLVAVPSFLVLGSPTSLTVTASDADGDALSYVWTSSCASAVFSAAAAATTVTLPVGAADTSCDLTVTVSDGKGGSTTGQTTLPVGAPVAVQAPSVTDSVQSVSVVDVNGSVNFSVDATDPQGSALTFAWVATAGVLANQINGAGSSQVVWTAPATEKTAFTVSVIATNALGASTQYDFSVSTAALASVCTPPASTAWKFGVMSDTQWTTADPAGKNPTTVSVSIIDQLNPQFIAAGVKFVIQVGDLADTGNDADETVRAQAAQQLLDAGIGFFPMRGNHETYGAANSFAIPVLKTLYPQTRGVSNTFGATNFSSPTDLSTELDGMTYSFDYNNARFVILDTWATPSVDISAAGYSYGYSVAQQQPWINSRLDKTTRGTDHAFVMSHQPLMAESHQDTMFQGYSNANPAMQNAFYASLNANNVKYFLAGHDHMNQHSIIASPDGTSNVHEIIGSSDSSKFYTPSAVSGANWFGQKVRETPIAQELYTVGYYIYTVDGPNVTVDFYSDTHGSWQSDANYPMGTGNAAYPINVTPNFTFAKKHTFGYGQNGTEFLVAEGASYPTTPYTFAGTTARFLAGMNGSAAKDFINRPLTHAVDIGWTAGTCATFSSIMNLWGTTDIGSSSGDTIALSMSFDRSAVSDATLVSGGFGLATQDSAGNWTNAVAKNVGGTPAFVLGAWNASYGLGTFGVDPATNTAWAVVNHQGQFAIARF